MKKVIAILCLMFFIFALAGCGDEPAEEPDENGWVQDDYTTFMAIVQNTADDYISGYKTPWGLDDWKFVKYDNENIIVITECELKETSVKQQMVCTFTWRPETEEYKAHYFSVGGTVFLDDGVATPKL